MRTTIFYLPIVIILLVMGTFCGPNSTNSSATGSSQTTSTLTTLTTTTLSSATTTLTTTLTTLTTTTLTSTTTTLCFSSDCDGVLLIGGSDVDSILGSQAIKQSADGGFILTGVSRSTDGDFTGQGLNGGTDIAVVKLTADGTFDNSFGGGDGRLLIGGTGNESGLSIDLTSDGGFIVAGTGLSSDGDFAGQGAHGNNDIIVVKLMSDGTFDTGFGGGDGILLIGGSGNDRVVSVNQTADGGYIILGKSISTDMDFNAQGNQGSDDWVLIKLTSNGSFDNSFAGDGILFIGSTGSDQPNGLTIASDGSFLVTGWVAGASGGFAGEIAKGFNDLGIVKLSSTGILDASFAGDGMFLFGGSQNDSGQAIMESSDGGYMITGYSASSDGDLVPEGGTQGIEDMLILKLTSSGAIDTSFGGGDGIILIGGTNSEFGNAIVDLASGYMIAGSTGSSNGDFTGQGTLGGGDSVLISVTDTGALNSVLDGDGILILGGTFPEQNFSMIPTSDGALMLLGFSQSSDAIFTGQGAHGNNDIYVIKLNEDGTF